MSFFLFFPKIYNILRDHICIIPQTPCLTQFTGLHLLSFTMQHDFRIMELRFVEIFCIKLSKNNNFYSKNTQYFFSIFDSPLIQCDMWIALPHTFKKLVQYFFGTIHMVLSIYFVHFIEREGEGERRGRERGRGKDKEREREEEAVRGRGKQRERDRARERERGRKGKRWRERGRENERERERERERRQRERERERERKRKRLRERGRERNYVIIFELSLKLLVLHNLLVCTCCHHIAKQFVHNVIAFCGSILLKIV